MDLIATISSSVIFLFAGDPAVPIGTAFIVGYPDPRRPGYAVSMIVTAKHVLADHSFVAARFSPKEESKGFQVLNYDIKKLKADGDYWEHVDPGVDIAVFRTPSPLEAAYSPVPLYVIATKEIFKKEAIRASDRVLFPSLLVNFMGSQRNYPTVRDGSIALIPDEAVPMEYKVGTLTVKTAQPVLMLNAISIPGVSGSPVFLAPGPRLNEGNYSTSPFPYLLGVMHGFYPALPREVVEISTGGTRPMFAENAGIAIIFPAWRLLEILERPELKARIDQLYPKTNP